jgi:hypothetical protein
LVFRQIFLQKKDDHHVFGELLSRIMEIVGEREKYSKYKKRQTYDSDGEKVTNSILPEVPERLFEKVL